MCHIASLPNCTRVALAEFCGFRVSRILLRVDNFWSLQFFAAVGWAACVKFCSSNAGWKTFWQLAWLGCWTCDQQVTGLNPARPAVEYNLGKFLTRASVTKQCNLVPANGRGYPAAGKVTVGLASHWPHTTGISGSSFTGSRPRRGRWAPTYAV